MSSSILCDGYTFKLFLGKGPTHPYQNEVMMTYLTPCQWMPTVSSIDLYSPLVEILIYFTTCGPEKYSKTWEYYSLATCYCSEG